MAKTATDLITQTAEEDVDEAVIGHHRRPGVRFWLGAAGLILAVLYAVVVPILFHLVANAAAPMAVLGPGLVNVLIVLSVVWTPLTIRMARASVLEILSQGYVEAAQALGAGLPSIFFRHVLRNAIDPVLVQQTVAFTGAILGEATFSFIGAGLQPPDTSLGMILSEAQQNLY